jgi:hypothetical protein
MLTYALWTHLSIVGHVPKIALVSINNLKIDYLHCLLVNDLMSI